MSTEADEFSQQLEKWIPISGNWTICWRATEHGWQAETFHKNCDGKAPTLTLVKVIKDRKNMTFGGYATKVWDDAFGCEYVYVCCFINHSVNAKNWSGLNIWKYVHYTSKVYQKEHFNVDFFGSIAIRK